MGTETQLVKVEHLYKEFDENTKVLEDINLTINKNEVIAARLVYGRRGRSER